MSSEYQQKRKSVSLSEVDTPVKLTIRTLDDNFDLEVVPSVTTVADLKKMVENKTGNKRKSISFFTPECAPVFAGSENKDTIDTYLLKRKSMTLLVTTKGDFQAVEEEKSIKRKSGGNVIEKAFAQLASFFSGSGKSAKPAPTLAEPVYTNNAGEVIPNKRASANFGSAAPVAIPPASSNELTVPSTPVSAATKRKSIQLKQALQIPAIPENVQQQ